MNQRNQGFGLAEIMVGLAVGLVSMLVIFQLYSTFEDQKRATTTGGDAQTNGALAQYVLEREIRSAGNGITEGQPQQYPPVAGCLTNVYDKDKKYLVPNFPPDAQTGSQLVNAGNEAAFRFVPAVITAGAAGPTAGRKLSDSITIVSGTTVISAPYVLSNGNYLPGDSEINLTSNAGINFASASKDMLVVIERDTTQTVVPNPGLNYIVPKRCALLQAMALPDKAKVTVTGGRYNRPGGTSMQPTFTGEARLYNLGLVNLVTYRIAPPNGALPADTTRNLVADITKFGSIPNGTTSPAEVDNLTDFSPMASNIVNMQAQYGVDTGNPGSYLSTCPTNTNAPIEITDADGVVDPATGWVEPTEPAWVNNGTTTPTLFDLRRIRAIRIGLIARSAVKEVPKPGDPVNYPNYPECSSTTTQPTIHWDSGPDMKPDLARDATDKEWQCYRYKVFQTTIPIRNAIWSSTMNPASPASCGLR